MRGLTGAAGVEVFWLGPQGPSETNRFNFGECAKSAFKGNSQIPQWFEVDLGRFGHVILGWPP